MIVSGGQVDVISTNAGSLPANTKYPGYWTLKRLRRGLRNRLNRWLSAAAQPVRLEPIQPATIRRVLICRSNKRLGNTLFLIPLQRAVASALPGAQVDLLIRDAGHRDLFQGLPGLCRVWSMPARGWLFPFRLAALLHQLRRQDYDLCIEPTMNSFSNRLLARLCGGRRLLGFHTADQWLRQTHAVTPDPQLKHEALKPLQLIRRGISGVATPRTNARLALTTVEQHEGELTLSRMLGRQGGPIIGFFIEATGNKRLPNDWWKAWLAHMRTSARRPRLLQILPPGTTPALDSKIAFVRETNLRNLAGLMQALNLFVVCDSGPMHLAAAAGTHCLGLFHRTRAERYAPMGKHNLALDVSTLSPAQVAAATLAQLDALNLMPANVRPIAVGLSRKRLATKVQQPIQKQVQVPAEHG